MVKGITRHLNVIQHISGIRDHYLVNNARRGARLYFSDNMTLFFAIGLLVILFATAFGPMLIPYEYDAIQRDDQGQMLRAQPPSADHVLGTTARGYDVFSRILYGARPTILTGFTGGTIIVSLGLVIGVTAGYYGGRIDGILMRFTDFAYGVPLIPTAIVTVAYLGVGFWSTVLIIGLLLWQGNARVFRSQTLQIREREHVQAAELLGASNRFIIFRHILPNMVGMIMLFFALGIGLTILIAASLAFLGFLNPFIPTWGIMLRNTYSSGYMAQAWWWTLSAGFAISFTVLCVFMLGRGYERITQTEAQIKMG